jgi:hypothetical protein
MKEQSNGSRAIKAVLILIGIFLVLAIIGAAGDAEESAPTPSVTPVAAEQEVKAKPEAPKTWQTVAELSGTNTKRGEVFALTGAQARLTYETDGQEYSFVSVYIVEAGDSLDESGGFPEVSAGEGTGETVLVNPAGSYYLDVNGYGGWTVKVEELK